MGKINFRWTYFDGLHCN